MNNIIEKLNQFASNQKLCAVYFQSPNGLSNLKFHYLIFTKNQWEVSTRTLNDEKFFKHIYSEYNIGKNEFLDWININIKKEKYLHLPDNLDVIISIALN